MKLRFSLVKFMLKEKSGEDKCRVDYCTLSLDYFTIQQEIRILEGKLLTIIDAMIVEDKQNKAFKDLVRNELHISMNRIAMLCTPKGERERFIN